MTSRRYGHRTGSSAKPHRTEERHGGPLRGALGQVPASTCVAPLGVWASGTFGRRVMDYRVTSQRLAQLCRAACGSPIKGDPQGDPGRLPTEDSCIVWTRGFLFCRMCFVLRRDDSRERASVANNIIMRASGHGDGRYPGPGHLRGDLGPDHHSVPLPIGRRYGTIGSLRLCSYPIVYRVYYSSKLRPRARRRRPQPARLTSRLTQQARAASERATQLRARRPT
jgi:hypothetical protein